MAVVLCCAPPYLACILPDIYLQHLAKLSDDMIGVPGKGYSVVDIRLYRVPIWRD